MGFILKITEQIAGGSQKSKKESKKHFFSTIISPLRGVARRGAEGARAPPEFGRSVNSIQTRWCRLCHSHYCQPPRIQKAIYISAALENSWVSKEAV